MMGEHRNYIDSGGSSTQYMKFKELLYLSKDIRKFYTFLSWNNYFKLRGCLGGLLSKWLHL